MTLQSAGIYISEYRLMKLLIFLSRPTSVHPHVGIIGALAWRVKS
jgi:hypothetical protein